VLFLALFGAAQANAQVSPGPLSRAHKSISGPTQCTSCHQIGVGKSELKCFDCHPAIKHRVQEGRGLHATFVPRDSAGQACASCHSEHNGENFNLLNWNPAPGAFDHSKTGYALEGKHAGLDCRKCHSPEHIADSEKRLLSDQAIPRTFLGLSRDCLTCHADAHRGQLGKNCQGCHDFAGWKPAARFSHARTSFPLVGAHEKVACQKCHPAAQPGNALKFAGIAFEKCTSCHADPHKGAFVQTCQTCHNTASWKQVSAAGKFDHSRTDFPLLGKHMSVACGDCHHAADFKREIAHGNCSDCHRPDPHSGQFAKRPDRGECSSCHTVEGFKPAKYSVKDHAQTAYPLEGKHALAACAKCHLPAGKATLFKVKFAACLDCHRDEHNRQFALAPHANRCERCHTVQTYRPSTFTLARHQESRFALTGGHIAVACMECHRAPESAQPQSPAPYHFADTTCSACHADPHNGQFRERMARASENGKSSGCESCHSTKRWRDVTRFDHATTTFALTGTHRAVACLDCHRPPNLGTNLRNVVFRSAPVRCAECHADAHGGQFASGGRPTICADCHVTAKWKPSLFDHDKRTSFPLQGGHQGVRCSACHRLFKDVDGRDVLFYRPTRKECAACHVVSG
jgi:hypothetical protein